MRARDSYRLGAQNGTRAETTERTTSPKLARPAQSDLRAAAQKALNRGCMCKSSTGEEWHSKDCPIPDFREALASALRVQPGDLRNDPVYRVLKQQRDTAWEELAFLRAGVQPPLADK